MNQPLVVVIVDDHELFAQGLALLLESKAGDRFRVGGFTTRVEEAADLAGRCAADLAIVDLAMPPLGGEVAIRQIKARQPPVRVLALSGSEDPALVARALRAGADGYLPKSADPDVLLAPLLTVAAGLRVLPARALDALLTAARTPPEELLERLDGQDRTLWVLLARGLETAEIAARMFVSERTAKRMVAALLHKLGVPTRIEAAALAGQYGLLDRPDEAGAPFAG
jgi:DNA-binding NarL/FixJ family response regulator